MDCSTIIVSYNTFELTKEAVSSALNGAPGLEHEVIVVDNASPDQSAVRLRDTFPEPAFPNVHIVSNGSNLGFSRANNQGAGIAQGDVLFFLNPDTIVLDGAIYTLYTFVSENADVGAVGPRVINPDGSHQRSAFDFLSLSRIINKHYPLTRIIYDSSVNKRDIDKNIPIPVDVVDGCAICIRTDVFDEVGGWDESYFMYAEETELCWYLTNIGYKNYLTPSATIIHYRGASTKDEYYSTSMVNVNKGVLQYLRRHKSPALIYFYRFSGIVGFGIRSFIFSILHIALKQHKYLLKMKSSFRILKWFIVDFKSN